jgi:protease I
MNDQLKGKKIAILVSNGFEQIELAEPKRALEESGALTYIVSPEDGQVKGWNDTEWGDSFTVDHALEEAQASEYDALLLPGGVMNPDNLRQNEKAVSFVRQFFAEGKPVAAICHAPSLLIEAGVVQGRRMTSYPSIKTDLINAGAQWVDEEVVTQQGLTTSRKPDDIPAFNRKMIEEIAEGMHQRQSAS